MLASLLQIKSILLSLNIKWTNNWPPGGFTVMCWVYIVSTKSSEKPLRIFTMENKEEAVSIRCSIEAGELYYRTKEKGRLEQTHLKGYQGPHFLL
jgi:hypothetical protein